MSIRTLAAVAVFTFASLPVMAEIMVHDSYARSASPAAKSGAAFMHIMNTGDTDDRLVEVRSSAAQRIELHTHVMDDGVAHMMQVEGGFVIPAGDMAVLERGGNHVMMMGLTAPFIQGESITLTFVFENAGEITADVEIDLERMPDDTGHNDMDHENMEASGD